jgi:hypothetical protein
MSSLSNLGNAMCSLALQLGRMEDLEEAITFTAKHLLSALLTIPIAQLLSITSVLPCPLALSTWEGWRIWRRRLHVTAKHLLSTLMVTPIAHLLSITSRMPCPLFQQSGRMEDLEEAITCHREALTLRPHGHPDRSSSLSNLGVAIHSLSAVGKDGGFGGGDYMSPRSTCSPPSRPSQIALLLLATSVIPCSLALSS